jgi:vacuolar protein sorting-associated protein 13A/C
VAAICQQYNEEEEDQRRQALKLEKLQNAELLQEKSTAGMSQEEEQKNQSFVASLTTKVGLCVLPLAYNTN